MTAAPAAGRPHARRTQTHRAIPQSLAALLTLALLLGAPLALTGTAEAQTGLQFNGTNQSVTFGNSATLNAASFTIECWVMRTGTSVNTSTGTGGWGAITPLVSKGRGEAETPDNLNMNYFLGIRSDSVLCVDFEEPTGPNRPLGGTRALRSNLWYHVAATYDVTTGQYRLYLNGQVEKDTTLTPGTSPASTSIQHAGLATAMTSAGTTAGFFNGRLDEVRIWSVARTQGEIQGSLASQLTSGTGLIARWGLNEGTGSTATNSIGGSANGTLVNAPTWVPGSSFSTNYAVDFFGTNGVATFGNPAALGLSTYTVECWFRRDGAGTSTNSGSGGAFGIPLLAHGRGDQDTGIVHVNWFLAIRESDGVLMADFEESAAGANPHLNHPVFGVTPIVAGDGWHHAAATYDGTTWMLYLDGNLEGTLVVGQPAGHPTVMPVSIGSALSAAGTAEGFFNGVIDEARVWNVARSQAEIQGDINDEIATPAAGLVARWGMNEGAGNTLASTAGITLNGTLTASGWTWTTGAPFDMAVGPPAPPADPSGLAVTALTATRLRLDWTDGSNNETRFEVERSTAGAGGPFTLRATLGPNVVTWADSLLTPDTEYCYRVRAANLIGNSGYTNVDCETTPLVSRTALDLNGGTYVTFGDAAAVDLPQFTIECWFRRDGTGTAANAGTGGVTSGIPLVTNGRGESEASNVDLNWFLGIRTSDNVLAADFEEGAGGSSPSLNHPVFGTTPIPADGTWHHAAATYDGTTWNLYLDGNLETTLVVGQPVASASTQHTAIGTALNSTGVAEGAFDGAFDEVRVWSAARTIGEIRGAANAEIDAATPGLVARWSLDEGAGTAVGGSAGTAVNGTITGAGYAWIGPAPFDLEFNDPPALPALVGPPNGGTNVNVATPLRVSVSDPDADSVTVSFYGRTAGGAPGPDFTIIPIPDTQYYTGQLNGGSNAILKSQMDWIVANRVSRNIAYAVQLGDCVEHGQNGDLITNNPIEWMRADSAFLRIEDPFTTGLADGIPYGICAGNHDQTPMGDANGSTAFYNQYFGIARFSGRAYYGGPHRGSNDNWFDLFSAGGFDFISIGLEYDTSPDQTVLDWADSLLKAYPGRRAMVSTHHMVNNGNPGTFSTQGQAIYDNLRDNPNLFLMLGGHVGSPGEGRRTDTFEGNTVHSMMSDYQHRANGGSGWLRILEFSPANNVIRVRTYSPWLNQFEADADSSSQFTLAYPMGGSAAAFTLVGTVKVASGETASMAWPGLAGETAYEWYATVNDGGATRTGPTWSFTTAEAVAPTVTVVAPNGGQSVGLGQNLGITWTASDNVAVTSVDVLLSRTGAGGPWETLATGLPNTGSTGWTVSGTGTTDAYVRVVAHDAAANSGEDVSDAAFTISSTVGVGDGAVAEFALGSITPNPARGDAHVHFALPVASQVTLRVFDAQGREVAVLARRAFPAGRHELSWNGRGRSSAAPSGIYFVRMDVPGRAALVRRVALIR